jgi:3D (Asp-Asp-Asp) domain-containing protein
VSRGTKIASVTASVLAVVGTSAIVAALAVGLTGWPPARAQAASAPSQGALGIGDRTTGPVALNPTPEEKIAPLVTATGAATLLTPVRMAKAPVPKLTGARASLGGGWRSARASWYGPGFYGHTMAGGGRLSRGSMIVAHKSLPFGTRVLVQWRGRSVVAVVRDRGPFIAGREFDLGPGTARAVGFGGVGTIRYRLL